MTKARGVSPSQGEKRLIIVSRLAKERLSLPAVSATGSGVPSGLMERASMQSSQLPPGAPASGQVEILGGHFLHQRVDTIERRPVTVSGRDQHPRASLDRVLGDFVRVVEQIADVEEGLRLALGGASQVPLQRQAVVLRDALAVVVTHAHARLGVGMAEVGGAQEPVDRPEQILRDLAALTVTQRQMVHRVRIARLGADL